MFKKLSSWIWPTFDAPKTKMLIGAGITRLKLHQTKKRELVKKERKLIQQLIAEKDYEVARAKAASCIRDELVSEAYAILEILLTTAKQRMQLISLYQGKCPQELEEPFHTLVFAATRTEVPELKELTSQLMLLYGEDWGKAANVDAHGLANAKVVRKLTIFANETLVRQYLVDVMGPEFDANEAFEPTYGVLGPDGEGDLDGPQNAARMERELAALRAHAAAKGDGGVSPMTVVDNDNDDNDDIDDNDNDDDGFPAPINSNDIIPGDVYSKGQALFTPVEESSDDDDDDDNNGGGDLPEAPLDLKTDELPCVIQPPSAADRESIVPSIPVGFEAPSTPIAPAVDQDLIEEKREEQELAKHADDLLARFNALKPKKSPLIPEPTAPPPAAPATDLSSTTASITMSIGDAPPSYEQVIAPAAPAPVDEDAETMNLLSSFPTIESLGHEKKEEITNEDKANTLSNSALEGLLPSIPDGDDDDIDNPNDFGGGMVLPSTPTTQLSHGIRAGSEADRKLNESLNEDTSIEDLAARFAKLQTKKR